MRHSAISRYHWLSGRMSAEFSVGHKEKTVGQLRRLASVCALILVLAGCATPKQLHQQALKNDQDFRTMRNSCCLEWSELKFERLRLGKTSWFKFTSQTTVFNLGEKGREAYVAAIEIPPRSKGGFLMVKAFGQGIWIPTALNLYPEFHFFNEAGEPIELEANVEAAPSDWSDPPSLRSMIRLPPGQEPLRLLVSPKLSGTSLILSESATQFLPNGPLGKIKVFYDED
jgi:hypothetical protein